MSLRLVQLRMPDGERRVASADAAGNAHLLREVSSTWELACLALRAGETLAQTAAARASAEPADLDTAERENRLLPPIDHPDPAHLWLTGTGLTHLGSAEGRDRMHQQAAGEAVTDSMRMFRLGLEGGRPEAGRVGAQPEWFYKGNGAAVVAPGAPLPSPAFALDAGEEPEIAGIYVIDEAGTPRRLGFCLANELSDHVTERGNYLWLAHSKLRPAALGPELLERLPEDVRGTSRILRDGRTIWEKAFLTGEANMCHSIANLEHHHFKYPLFCAPGDVHVHFFGTATLSYAEGVSARAGDVFEIEAPPFRLALRNPLAAAADERVRVEPL